MAHGSTWPRIAANFLSKPSFRIGIKGIGRRDRSLGPSLLAPPFDHGPIRSDPRPRPFMSGCTITANSPDRPSSWAPVSRQPHRRRRPDDPASAAPAARQCGYANQAMGERQVQRGQVSRLIQRIRIGAPADLTLNRKFGIIVGQTPWVAATAVALRRSSASRRAPGLPGRRPRAT
jgi:hypothetical protein